MENEQKIVEDEAVAEESAAASDSLNTVELSDGRVYTFKRPEDLPFRQEKKWVRRWWLLTHAGQDEDKALEAEAEMACLSAGIDLDSEQYFSEEDSDKFLRAFDAFLADYTRPVQEQLVAAYQRLISRETVTTG